MCKEKTAGSAQIVELRFIGGWVEFYLIEGVYLCFPSLFCFCSNRRFALAAVWLLCEERIENAGAGSGSFCLSIFFWCRGGS